MKNYIALIIGLFFTFFTSLAQNPLYIPPILNGPTYDLTIQNGTSTFLPSVTSNTIGFNGPVLGPTLIMQAGQNININVLNNIGEPTTVHWHGLHVSPENDGGPYSVIAPNQTFSPKFKVMNKAATYWYHPHLHLKTDQHVNKGAQGMIIVKDEEENALNLPRTYGVDDFPLIVKTISVSPISGIINSVNTGSINVETYDIVKTVNATINPFLEVPKQLVRLRLLNAASHRVFEFGLSNNAIFKQIASDAGLLSAPYSISRLRLAPGERAEIIVDFSAYTIGTTILLNSYSNELPNGMWGASASFSSGNSLPGYTSNPLNGSTTSYLEFRVIAPTSNPILSTPSTLANVPPSFPLASNSRAKTLFAFDLQSTINNGSYPNSSTNETIKLNAIEVWDITSQDAQYHPFHLHDVSFYIVGRKPAGTVNFTAPHTGEQGLKDVVLIHPNQTVRIIAKFNDFTSDIPYVYHCHILPHEDRGMMAEFTVEDNVYIQKDYTAPNPAYNGSFYFPTLTIRAGLNYSQDGTTLVFKTSGEYIESTAGDLLINKNVTFKSLTGQDIIIK
jgi:blue copper oxidase